MILIPQRLFGDARVRILLRQGNRAWLHKRLDTPVLEREGYVSNHVVSIVMAGEQRIRPYEAAPVRVRAREVLLLPRGLYHITDLLPTAGAFESLLCYFDENDIQTFLAHTTLTELQRQEPPIHLRFGARPDVALFADTLLQLYGSRTSADEQLLALKTQELLLLLARAHGEAAFTQFLFSLTLPRKRRLVDFMENNYTKPLRVEDYARLTGRSLSSFRRDCQEQLGSSPQRWLLRRRIRRAQELLRQTDQPVAEVAGAVGYEHPSNFVRAFRRQTGQAPSAFRQRSK